MGIQCNNNTMTIMIPLIAFYLYWINVCYKHITTVVDSLVFSHLTYALPVWGPAQANVVPIFSNSILGCAYSEELEQV